MKEIRLLTEEEIEVRVKQVFAKDEKGKGCSGAIALLYKTSRTDMNILDETFGPMNWTDDYRDIDGVLYCGIGARENESKPFVWKWSNGIESRKDDEGNEVKGEASDAFKRAGFLWGIGRELYTAPFIWLNVETVFNNKGVPIIADKKARFYVNEITYRGKRIKSLQIVNQKDEDVFYWDDGIIEAEQKRGLNDDHAFPKATPTKPMLPEDKSGEKLPWDDELPAEIEEDIWETAKRAGLTEEQVILGITLRYQKRNVSELTVTEANDCLRRFEDKIKEQKK